MAQIHVQSIILNKEKYILLTQLNNNTQWQLPKGSLLPEETPWQGIVRNVLEISGLNIKINHILGVYTRPEQSEILFTFVCDIVSGELIDKSETRMNKFFNSNNLPENIDILHKERIMDSFHQVDKPVFKIQEPNQSIDLVHLIAKQ